VDRPIETGFAFANLSTRFYAALRIRPHALPGAGQPFAETRLLPPGGVERVRFLGETASACPGSIDLQILLYQRVNEDVPIGLDETEAVIQTPIAAGQIDGVPACDVQPVETYTIVNWEADEGVARVKLAQGTPVEDAIRRAGLFPNEDAVWEVVGVDPDLAGTPPPSPAPNEPISGRVVLADGTGLEGVGVLLRSRYRTRLSEGDQHDIERYDAGYGDPIAITQTDALGVFQLDRPAGAYRVEFFADDLLFRPVAVDVETPAETIIVVAEPI
jgi:hypothetical protein